MIIGDAVWECGRCHRVQVIAVPQVSYNHIGPRNCSCEWPIALHIPCPVNQLAKTVEMGWAQMREHSERLHRIAALKERARFFMNQPHHQGELR